MLSRLTNLCLQFQSLKPCKCLFSHIIMCLPQPGKTASKKPTFWWERRWQLWQCIFYLETFHKIASFLRCNFCSWRCYMWWYSYILWWSGITQEILTNEKIVAELRADDSDVKEEEVKEKEQEADLLLMEKPSVSQIREVLNLLSDFALITGNEEMLHILIKASNTT